MTKYLLVMAGGALGAVSRFLVSDLIASRYAMLFPLATFLINVTGSFLIGLLMMLFVNHPAIHPGWRLFLVTGVLGGYTTFSSFEWEFLALWRGGAVPLAFLYVLSSVALGMLGVWAGALLANRFWPH